MLNIGRIIQDYFQVFSSIEHIVFWHNVYSVSRINVGKLIIEMCRPQDGKIISNY